MEEILHHLWCMKPYEKTGYSDILYVKLVSLPDFWTTQQYHDTNLGEPSQEDVLQRAMSRVGDEGYNLVWNNCEHFAVRPWGGGLGSALVRRWVKW